MDGIRWEQFNGPWAIEPMAGATLHSTVKRLDLEAHVQEYAARVAARGGVRVGHYDVIDGVAVIDIVGSLTKYGFSLGVDDGAIGRRAAVRRAAQSADVRGILLRIDSPGGTVAGIGDLAREVREANAVKPVVAYIEDMGASAAYWIASQARRILANGEAMVGSLGVYTVVRDSSAASERAGVRVHVIRAGEFKGAGQPGAPVTDAHLADVQRVVDEVNSRMLTSIAEGRRWGLAQAQARADGRIHIGMGAVKAGFVDGIGTFETAMAAVGGGRVEGMQAAGVGAGGKEQVEMSKAEQNQAMAELFEARVRERIERGINRQEAFADAARKDPRGHKAWLALKNPNSTASSALLEQANR